MHRTIRRMLGTGAGCVYTLSSPEFNIAGSTGKTSAVFLPALASSLRSASCSISIDSNERSDSGSESRAQKWRSSTSSPAIAQPCMCRDCMPPAVSMMESSVMTSNSIGSGSPSCYAWRCYGLLCDVPPLATIGLDGPDFKLAYRETAVLPWATLIPWKDRKKHGQVFDHYLTEY